MLMITGRVSGGPAGPVVRRLDPRWLLIALLPLVGVFGVGQARAALPSNCDQ